MKNGSLMDRETLIESAFIVAFFAMLLFLGPATAANHKLEHKLPTGYSASDSYQHQARAQAIYDMGQYKKEAPYMMMGFEDVTGFYPPMLLHLSVILARTSGLPVHDALQIIVGLALTLGAVMMYFFARAMGKSIAILSLPLTIFITTGAPFLGAVTFGQMPFALSSMFLVATAWAITKIELKRSYILIAAALAGSIMTHTSETLFFSMFMAIAFGAAILSKISREKINAVKAVFTENKAILTGLGLAAALTLYFWPLFIGIWLKIQPYRGIKVETESASFPAATVHIFNAFGHMMYAFIMIGLIAAIIIAIQKKSGLGTLLHNPKIFPLAFSAWMMAAGFGTYLGFGLRSFQTRLYWPITLAPLAGFGIYNILRPITSTIKKGPNMFIIAAATTLILSAFIVEAHYQKPVATAMPEQHWETMRWIAQNSTKNAKVGVLYSQILSQTSMLYNDERVNYFVEFPEAVNIINEINANNGTLGRTRQMSIATDSGSGVPYRKGLFSFGQHTAETSTNGKFDICGFDYYMIDLAFDERNKALQQLNFFMIQKFARHNMTAEHQNDWVIVMKNNNKGGECLA